MTAVLRAADGSTLSLEVDRWRGEPDPVERALLDALAEPVLDIGCGPGRIVADLASRGRVALGIDASPHAVGEARSRGAPALVRSVFAPLPGEGRWGAVVLLDGNIGIGGDPVQLLVRCARLLRPGGTVLAEVAPPGAPTGPVRVRVERGALAGPWFPWARVSGDAWAELAGAAGFDAASVEQSGGRWFGRGRQP